MAFIFIMQSLECMACLMNAMPASLGDAPDLRILLLDSIMCGPEALPTFLSQASYLPRLLWLSLAYQVALDCSDDLKAAVHLRVG